MSGAFSGEWIENAPPLERTATVERTKAKVQNLKHGQFVASVS